MRAGLSKKNDTVRLPTNILDDRPTLILGMIGFSRAQEDRIEKALADRPVAAVRWRTGALSKADAWWVSGTRTQLLDDGSLRIGSLEPGGRSVRLALEQVTRPIAFAEPLASRDFEPAYSFGIDDPASMATILAVMETKWLACTAVRCWLAGHLIAAEHALTQRIYHLVRGERLLAVVDRAEAIGWVSGLTVEELADANWIARPMSARDIPHSFQRATISELVWDYALRSQSDLLPARYRSHRIYFRRPPKVAPDRFGDEHLLIMRELAVRPGSFAELVERTGLGSVQLAQALAALYFTGSITSNRRRVPHAEQSSRIATGAASTNASLWGPSKTGSGFDVAAIGAAADFTVPASLPK